MSNDRDIRIIKTKRAIREAVLELLMSTNVSCITVRDVADAAYIDRRTFQAHYRSVGDVIDEIVDMAAQEVLSIVDAGDKTSWRGISAMLSEISRLSQDSQSTFGKSLHTSVRRDVQARLSAALAERIVKRIAAGSETELGDKKYLTYRRTYLADYVANGLVGLCMRWICGGRDMSEEEISTLAFDLFRDGLARIKAQALPLA
ncbi:MAG: TetR-like C-terminal domain-containing protein [Atopobiaceae bacterium]